MGKVEDMRSLGPPGAARRFGAKAPKLTKPEAKVAADKVAGTTTTPMVPRRPDPEKVTGAQVQVRLQPDQLAHVDRWRSAGETRADVIRALIQARMNRGG